ncbi:MAG: LOW QUALITY PROTEIN: hypothetical protein BJ554DRAFT_5607 [Olpidium bornovanus]|uniref:tRNA/rRNA methyltransferase SpoU type domain-containing protein n=1 Tax=Olpidium bornovanus TaxID=278681 RepID=A0A8H8DLC9_9FUNG|nr:MAG: LOW QUALITY PROTEIN: hypothetical protein BJ554DRAFT_5607 [Olpidium bornovanus]
MKEDDQFKALSMNAEHWIRLTEVSLRLSPAKCLTTPGNRAPAQFGTEILQVPEKDLETYLMSKKDENYTIIGLEQTTNSMRLSDYRFPSKSRERDGIPPHLLQLVDQTLEIPQYGVTRSLNVHVSGALAVSDALPFEL